MHTRLLKRTQGFTLVEVMIVVAILAILSAIVIPLYNGYITTGHSAGTRQNAEPLRLALEDHFLDNQTYVVGNWIPGGDTSLETGPMGWHPDGDQGAYEYRVTAGATGSIATSYSLTVTSRIENNIVTTCERNQRAGTFDCVTIE